MGEEGGVCEEAEGASGEGPWVRDAEKDRVTEKPGRRGQEVWRGVRLSWS